MVSGSRGARVRKVSVLSLFTRWHGGTFVFVVEILGVMLYLAAKSSATPL